MRTLYEGARGCGFRKPGALYLVTDGLGRACSLLPVPLEVCPTCGGGVKPSRGWTWISPDALFSPHPHGEPLCPLEVPGRLGERAGLLWIGGSFYEEPEDWTREASVMGVSRRIRAVPRGFEIGETWVAVGHRRAVRSGYVDVATGTEYLSLSHAYRLGGTDMSLEEIRAPGVFHLFRPERIEYVVRGDETEEELEKLGKRGIEPVRVVPLEQQILGVPGELDAVHGR